MQKKQLTTIIVVLAVLAVGGVLIVAATKKDKPSGSQSASQSTAAAPKNAVAATAVTINDYAFGPQAIKVKTGDTVTWTNNDSVKHNIIADTASDAAPNGPLFGKGETYKFTFTKAGTYTYHCMPHPYMKGTVIVE